MTVRGHHTRTLRSVQHEFRHDLNAFKSVLALRARQALCGTTAHVIMYRTSWIFCAERAPGGRGGHRELPADEADVGAAPLTARESRTSSVPACWPGSGWPGQTSPSRASISMPVGVLWAGCVPQCPHRRASGRTPGAAARRTTRRGRCTCCRSRRVMAPSRGSGQACGP